MCGVPSVAVARGLSANVMRVRGQHLKHVVVIGEKIGHLRGIWWQKMKSIRLNSKAHAGFCGGRLLAEIF